MFISSAPQKRKEVISMPVYRRKKNSDTWHWCTNCSNWPTDNYDESYTKPSSGELCNECKSKEMTGTCRRYEK